jgi:protein-disulfide isomerase
MTGAGDKKWYTKWWAVIIYIFSFLVLLAILLLIFAPTSEQNFSSEEIISKFRQGNPNLTETEKELLYGSDSPTYGTAEEKVDIVTFFCFSCPGAKQMYSTIREIGMDYEDKVSITFRHFPTNEKSIQYSLAAECAYKQGKFWPMYDKLFGNQDELTPDYALTLAKQININMPEFSECLMDDTMLKKVARDTKEATELGVKGSPTTFINGYKIERPIPREVFMSIIEEILKE